MLDTFDPQQKIQLNYGGKIFVTTRGTLDKSPFFARLLSSEGNKDESGAYFVDGSPEYFEPILHFLRRGEIRLDANMNPEAVLDEAKFLDIENMPFAEPKIE